MHNSKIITIFILGISFYSSLYYLDSKSKINNIISEGFTIASSNENIIPLVNKKSQEQSKKIQDVIFNTKNTNNIFIDSNYYINNYLINIFCSETTSKYIKVASGSGIFLSDPDEDTGVVLTNAHVARHLLDSNKKCVGRTKSPTTTTHTVTLRYIPSFWLNRNNQYIIGDPDQNSTGEFDFALIEVKKIKPTKKDTSNLYSIFKSKLRLKTADYSTAPILNSTYIYSYPARKILSKNVNSPLFQKKDSVRISSIYSSPTNNIPDSLLDVTGSENIDHGSSGGMVISQSQNNYLIGLSSVLINENSPQIVRVVTLRHVLETIKNDLKNINNAQSDPFLIIIENTLDKKEFDLSTAQIFKNIKLTSVLEQNTKNTLIRLNIIK